MRARNDDQHDPAKRGGEKHAEGAPLLPLKRELGPLYGVASWGFFEVVVAPTLGLSYARQSRPRERVVLFLDHALFGLIVGSPPEAEIVGGNSDRISRTE